MMASKMGRRGRVDAILTATVEREHWEKAAVLCLASVREKGRLRAHMATAAPRISTFDSDSRCKASDCGSCVGCGHCGAAGEPELGLQPGLLTLHRALRPLNCLLGPILR